MYDAIVIGAGPAGYVCSIKMAQLGLKVLTVEREHAGGTCTNRGCIPTKAFLHVAHTLDLIKKATNFGVNAKYDVDFSRVKKHVERAILTSRKGVEYLLKKNGVELVRGEAVLKSPNAVEVEGKTFEGRNVIIATGSKPTLFPPFDSVDSIWMSDDVFEMKELPKSILIVGGGVVGVEMADIFSSFGVKVFIVEIMDHVLPGEDDDVADFLKRSLKRKGVEIFESSKVRSIEKRENFIVEIESEGSSETVEVERVLVSVGRCPNIPEGVSDMDVKVDRGIVTDDNLRTDVENVYAIGDVRGKIMLAHAGFHEGIVAALNVSGKNEKVDLNVVPSVVYTHPEVASVGIKEKDATEKHGVAKFPVAASGRAVAMGERDGFAKIVYEKDSGRVVGMSLVMPLASELIMEGVIAVKHGITVEELSRTIHPHPTISEVLLGAFEIASEGKAIHI